MTIKACNCSRRIGQGLFRIGSGLEDAICKKAIERVGRSLHLIWVKTHDLTFLLQDYATLANMLVRCNGRKNRAYLSIVRIVCAKYSYISSHI